MFRDNAVEILSVEPENQKPRFGILCGIPALERLIIANLEMSEFQHDPSGSILLLIDAPQGFALRQLEVLDRANLKVIVTTGNRSPEYWEDLWELQPAILLVGDNLQREVDTAIMQAAKGEHYRIVPNIETTLTQCERIVLRLMARGWTIERIASYRDVSPKTVYNTMSNICQKLQVPTRRAAMLYYWGRLDLLD